MERYNSISSKKEFAIKALFICFIATIVLSYVLYSLTLTMDLPLADHWRWLRQLFIPYLHGKKTFAEYLTGEFYPFSHSHIVTLFNVWVNYHLFDLNYKYEFYFGLLNQLILVTWLVRIYYNSTQDVIKPSWALFVSCLLLSIILSPSNVIPWSLVQFEYFYLLFSSALLIAFSKYLKNEFPFAGLAALVFISFFIGDAMGIAAIFSIIGFILVFELKNHYRTLLSIIAVLVLAYFLALLVIPNIENNPHSSITKLDVLHYILENPLNVPVFILKACAQSLLKVATIKLLFGSELWQIAQYIIGSFVLGFISCAIIAFFRFRKTIIKSDLPMLLITFFLVSLLGIISGRLLEFGPNIGEAHRYIRIFQIALLGATWINVTVLLHFFETKKTFRKPLITLTSLISILIIMGFLAHSVFAWKYHKTVLKNRKIIVDTLIIYADNKQVDIGKVHPRCSKDYCWPSVKFLQEKNLSIFKDY